MPRTHIPTPVLAAAFLAILLLTSCKSTTMTSETPFEPDTTSHQIQWETLTFGVENSVLRDVAIIDENNIWAVGEIRNTDSTYSGVHWDGSDWKLQYFPKSNGRPLTSITGIHYFDQNNIFLAAGSIYHWDGSLARLVYQRDIYSTETVQKLWSNSESNIYGVGTDGLIVHFNGQSWQKETSNVDVNLTDIWGSPDGNTMWACGWEDQKPTVLLQKTGSKRLGNGL